MTNAVRPVVLVVLDGFGIGDEPAVDPMSVAPMPVWRGLLAEWPSSRLMAAGEAVGLPAGQMGNSEVGHLNLGAGFPVLQDLPRINRAIADGSFATNQVLRAASAHARRGSGRLHLLGLIGPGGVHAHDDHLVAMVALAHDVGLAPDQILLHAFTDGRDTPPHSAQGFLEDLERRLAGRGMVATVSGRFWAMDRDQRWDRTELAFAAIARGEGPTAPDAASAIAAAYATGAGDEFIEPTVVLPGAGIGPGDAIVHMNFRADRARQMTQALALPHFSAFERGPMPERVQVATLTEYQAPAELPVEVAFPPVIVDGLAAHLARLGLAQLHVAETEKYAHVTYFFNGGVETPFPGEDRALVPSRRDVPTYDLAPQMSALAVTERLEDAIRGGTYPFILANLANADMVGHTGVWDAVLAALATVDACLARIVRAVLDAETTLVITADHGNVERMRDAAGRPHTAHTTADVPLVLVGDRWRAATLRDGILADVAPTVCDLMGISTPATMTGHSVLAEVPGAPPAPPE